jgi:nitrite reductase/ring-hydroxylating ferredoxin subunit
VVWIARGDQRRIRGATHRIGGPQSQPVPKQFLCSVAKVAPDCVIRIDIAGLAPIAVYNLGGKFYATDDTCTHGEASLAEGVVDGCNIVCPFHGGTFDIRTGEATGPPCIVGLRSYPVIVENDALYVEIQ